METEKVRIDKWLWSVRIYKTRSLATDACKRNWIKINGSIVKPSREVQPDDILVIRNGPVEKKLKVLGILDKRGSAREVAKFYEDITPQVDKENIIVDKKMIYSPPFANRVTKGRPSKKERRDLEEFFYGNTPS